MSIPVRLRACGSYKFSGPRGIGVSRGSNEPNGEYRRPDDSRNGYGVIEASICDHCEFGDTEAPPPSSLPVKRSSEALASTPVHVDKSSVVRTSMTERALSIQQPTRGGFLTVHTRCTTKLANMKALS